jgi:type IV pilus assembly protein PilE
VCVGPDTGHVAINGYTAQLEAAKMQKSSSRGFTLIELMVTVVVIAILATIVYPAYNDSVRKARRSDAKDALLRVVVNQEKYRANNTAYGSLADIGSLTTTPQGYYTISLDGAPTATAFTVQAVAQGDQAKDSGCTTMKIAVNAGSQTRTPANCW